MNQTRIWLVLDKDFGDEEFGPYDQAEVLIGSAADVDVRGLAALGVEPHHARLVQMAGTLQLVPVDRSAQVWLWRRGADRPEPVRSPVVVRPGDGFSLGAPTGIRFWLEARLERPGPARAPGASTGAGASGLRAGLMSELWRRARASALATYWGGMAEQTFRFFKQRQFLAPIYLVGFATTAAGWAGFAWQWSTASTSGHRATHAEELLEVCEATQRVDCSDGRASLGALATLVLRDDSWREAFDAPQLRDATLGQLRRLFAQSDLARAVARREAGSGGTLDVAAKLLDRRAGDLPAALARVLVWTTVNPLEPVAGATRNESRVQWSALRRGDEQTRACLRGPLRLSYRQGLALGLDVQVDALVGKDDVAIGKYEAVAAALTSERIRAVDEAPGQFRIASKDDVVSEVLPDGLCVALPEADDRDSMPKTIDALGAKLGVRARRLPESTRPSWIVARVVRLFALHLPLGRGADLDLDVADPITALIPLEQQDPEGVRVVVERTGELLANAIAVPCLLLFEDMRDGGEPFPKALGERPDFDACAILEARARHDLL